MFSAVKSAMIKGLGAELVQVEADVSNGLPMFHLVGYLSSEVKEAGERVRAAVRNSGYQLPPKRIVVNLSPANVRKRGTMYDLSIAVAVLAAMEKLPSNRLEEIVFVGELSLDGEVKPVPGVLPIALKAKEEGRLICIVPEENVREGRLVEGMTIIGVKSLAEVCEVLKKQEFDGGYGKENGEEYQEPIYPDFGDICGQHVIKRAVEIAVAGSHNLLMVGPPGCGKTSIAKCIPGILPPLTKEESIELTTIYSAVGELDLDCPLMTRRPFREVSYVTTKAALLGGGVVPKPGEITMAHKGVIFLDEITEFQRGVLESLRQPLETHKIRLVREKADYEFPADFLMIAAMNPCPCGNFPDLNRCTCSESQRQMYLNKLSQPFLDRIDLCVEVAKVAYEDLEKGGGEERSETIRKRIEDVRALQAERYKGTPISVNGQLKTADVGIYCKLGKEEKRLMAQAYDRLGLTARSYHKVLCVARTIADMEGCENIGLGHLREALGYRSTGLRGGKA